MKGEEFTMAIEFGRLEDVIALAREGKDVHAEIDLKKQLVTQIEKDVRQVSKVYVYGFFEEPAGAFWVNVNIANARLKMDYQRLKDAKITFEEKYF
jgi:hypothetical protein